MYVWSILERHAPNVDLPGNCGINSHWHIRRGRYCLVPRVSHLAPSTFQRYDMEGSLYAVTLLPCAVESHPTPDDIRGSSSPSRTISGVSSHVADCGSAPVPHECVQPSLSRSSSPSRSIHSPEHHVIFHPSCSHHVPKVA